MLGQTQTKIALNKSGTRKRNNCDSKRLNILSLTNIKRIIGNDNIRHLY